MSDDAFQSEPNRGLRVLEAVRRRLKRLEIETHLIRADLAHLEAGHELDIAEELESELDDDIVDGPCIASPTATESEPAAATATVLQVPLTPNTKRPVAAKSSAIDYSGIPTRIVEANDSSSQISRWVSPAWLLSVAVHVALLLACGSLTYAIFADESPPKSITLDLSNDAVTALNDAAVTTVSDPVEVDSPEIATGDGPVNLADVAIAEPLTMTTDATAEPVQGMGELNTLPMESGTMMAGLGSEGKPGVATVGPGGGSRDGIVGGRGHGGKPGRRAKPNSVNFFGTEAVGDRFVFLVDNSGSMKQGRMETT